MSNQELLNKTIENFITKYGVSPLFKTSEESQGIKTEIFVKDFNFPLTVGFSHDITGHSKNDIYILSRLEAFKNLNLELLK